MNESDISDWDCFSKLYEYANAGVQGQPNPSSIQVGVVNQDWQPSTLTWNSAPLLQ